MSPIVVLLLSVVALLENGVAQPQRLVFKPVTEIPADIPTCSESDADLNECMRSAFQQMMPRLRGGVKELNIPPMDPLEFERSSYQYSNGIVQGRIAMKDVRVLGLSDATFEKVDFEMKDGGIRMDVVSRVPQILVEGRYKADMYLNDIRLTPKGYFNVSMTNVVMTARAEGELFERGGHTYLRLKKFSQNPDVGDMRIYASGLLPDPSLNDIILNFVNQYWRQIYKAILPETLSTWEPLVIEVANEFLDALPFDLLLTKD